MDKESISDLAKVLDEYRLSSTVSHFATRAECQAFRDGMQAAIGIVRAFEGGLEMRNECDIRNGKCAGCKFNDACSNLCKED